MATVGAMHVWRTLGLTAIFSLTVAARADYAENLARIHVEAIGGRELLAGLKTLRAAGHVKADGRTLRFEMLAGRPNRVRVTTTDGGRTLIQGTDGSTVPWRLEPEKSPVPQRMGAAAAAEFMEDAEFDDQLVDPAGRGYQVDFAGETTHAGRRALKLLVTPWKQKPCMLLLDAETYFIVARMVTRPLPSGREVTIETRYSDFMPVNGIVLAHRIETYAEGHLLHDTVLETMETNPPIDGAVFAMPAAVADAANP